MALCAGAVLQCMFTLQVLLSACTAVQVLPMALASELYLAMLALYMALNPYLVILGGK